MATVPDDLQASLNSGVVTEQITINTLIRYLLGSRGAILDIATNPHSVWLGLLFVVSAGIAREYDREDLSREPWHILLPLAASLVTSLILFVLVFQLSVRRSADVKGFLPAYWSFLGLYWMTAPLAWFYAIPVERLLTPASAVKANLLLLAIVSIWRVCLIVRVIVVTYNANTIAVIPIVMVFANSLIIFFLELLPRPIPIMNIMAGVRLSESERTIASATLIVYSLTIITYPLWVIGAVVAFWFREPVWRPADLTSPISRGVDWSVWVLASLSIMGWGFILPATQREQQLRSRVESSISEGRLQEAVILMSSHPPSDFPPHWAPMSHLPTRDRFVRITDLMKLLADRPSDWVRQLLLGEFRRQLEVEYWFSVFAEMDDAEQFKVLEVLERLPERDDIIRDDENHARFRPILRTLAADTRTDLGNNPVQVSPKVREKARTLLNDFTGTKAIAK